MDAALPLPDCVPAGLSTWTAAEVALMDAGARAAFAQGLDQLGALSGVAQELTGPITSLAKLAAAEDQVLYLLCAEDRSGMLGFLKTGTRHLYLYNSRGKMTEADPLCLLDFYVHESRQRGGLGLLLFSAMLEREGVEPARLAYDRPSPKLMPFLRRHFGLVRFVEQPNRFVVFDAFFRVQ